MPSSSPKSFAFPSITLSRGAGWSSSQKQGLPSLASLNLVYLALDWTRRVMHNSLCMIRSHTARKSPRNRRAGKAQPFEGTPGRRNTPECSALIIVSPGLGQHQQNSALITVLPAPAPPSARTQLLALLCTAQLGVAESSAFISVLHSSTGSRRKLSFCHCFAQLNRESQKAQLLSLFCTAQLG